MGLGIKSWGCLGSLLPSYAVSINGEAGLLPPSCSFYQVGGRGEKISDDKFGETVSLNFLVTQEPVFFSLRQVWACEQQAVGFSPWKPIVPEVKAPIQPSLSQ